jgi:uncharacterized membrane protein YdbT with pleckstrin-like domain
MAYIDELLGRSEHILYVARQHLILLVSLIFAKVILIGVVIAAGVMSYKAFGANTQKLMGIVTANELILLCGSLISLILLLSIFNDFLRWNAEQYIVTDRRIIQVRGVFSKAVIDSSLDHIHNISMSQSWAGRLFHYGTIDIETAADDDAATMYHVNRPMEFKHAILEAKHNADRGYGYLEEVQEETDESAKVLPARLQNGQSDIQRTLEDLASLRDRGILSTDEFEAKKREILSRI